MSQRYKPVLTEFGLILRMWRSCKSMSMWRARGVGVLTGAAIVRGMDELSRAGLSPCRVHATM